VKAQTIGEIEIKHDMIILGNKGDVEIWYNHNDEQTPNFVDFELDHSENHQHIL